MHWDTFSSILGLFFVLLLSFFYISYDDLGQDELCISINALECDVDVYTCHRINI